jgi:subfamily B ATP-binding cassette protein MsbA
MLAFLAKIWGLARAYRARLALGVVTGVIAGVMEPLMIATVTFVYGVVFPGTRGSGPVPPLPSYIPGLFRDWFAAIQETVHTGVATHPGAMVAVVALIPGVLLLRGVFGYANVYFLQWVAVRTVADLRVRLFTHLMGLSAAFFNRSRSSELMSRIMSDTAALQGIISNSTAVIVKDPVILLATFSYLMWQEPKLTLMSLIVLPVCTVPVVFYSRRVRRASRAMQQHSAELTEVMGEAFAGQRIVKAYNLERRTAGLFQSVARKYVGHYMRTVRSAEVPGPLLEFVGSVGVALLFVYLIFHAGSRPGSADFLKVILAIFTMYRPLKNLTRLHNNLEQARAASERVFELLGTGNEIQEPAVPKPLQAARADIDFEAVTFAYGDKPVLEEINLHVRAGQVVALVGGSGSGKTTLTHLLLRFYDPTSGRIRIGGTDLREVSTHDLRDQIALVTQETVLFNETIRANIELGRPGASATEIEAAARHAHAHEFILEKEHGYDTLVGERGVALSGGQRQRLAIARALLKDAPILILDEATSALDTESERLVQEGLDELMKGRTVFVIAHRLSTVQNATLIVVLDRGRIVETGTHAELLAKNGVYRRLCELQFQLPPHTETGQHEP